MRRIFLIIFLITALIFIEIINWIFLFLDYIIYPQFKKTDVKPPLFITGMPRSATTLCHVFLAADSVNFSSMKLWEILFAPSIIQKKLVLTIKKIDAIFHHKLYRALSLFDRYFFKKMEDIHPVSFFDFEEDEYLLIHILSTSSFIFMFPKNKRLVSLHLFDRNLTDRQKRFIMRFYRNCIKRHLYVFGESKRYLAKSPSYTQRIRTFQHFFPGCQFIYMLRNPANTLASTLNLYRRFRKIFHVEMDMEAIIDQTLSMADQYYQYPLVTCDQLVGKSVFIVKFNELTSDTIKTIQLIYNLLVQELPDKYRNFLNTSRELPGKHISKSKSTLEEFGLKKEFISERYNIVYQKYPDIE